MTKYTLSCLTCNHEDTEFALIPPEGTPSTGVITVKTRQLVSFFQDNWVGHIRWNGRCPVAALEAQCGLKPGLARRLFESR